MSLSPAEEAGPDLPSRENVPDWVPRGKEGRWHDSEKVARDLMGDDEAAVWQAARTIFADEVAYPS